MLEIGPEKWTLTVYFGQFGERIHDTRSMLRKAIPLRQVLSLVTLLVTSASTLPSAHAQVTLSGTVRDYDTGETLPAANIRILGTYSGTISNADGVFRLVVPRVPATIVFRYVGYDSDSLVVEGPVDAPVTVSLHPAVYELGEVVVTDENRAIEVMRRVIARKKRMTERLQRYRVDAYNRFTLANDTGIVSVVETVTDAFWDRELGTREIVRMERRTSNVDFSGLPAAMLVSNLYADDIDLSGFKFVGVTNPRALSVYDFEIEGIRYRDEDLIYDISVKPKVVTSVAFEGSIAILDDESAMIEADLRPGAAFRFPPPFRDFEIEMSQQYDTFADSLWLPVDFRSRSAINIGVATLFEIPTIRIDQFSRLQNYEVNPELPAGLFADKRNVRVDSMTVRDAEIPDSLSVPLVLSERRAYETVDSTMTLDKAYQPTGAIARAVKVTFNFSSDGDGSGGSGGGSGPKRLKVSPSIDPIVQFDRVDGFKLGARPELSVGPFVADGGIAYSTALDNDHWSFDTGLRFRGKVTIGARWYDRTQSTFESVAHPQVLNSMTVLLGGSDYFDYYRRQGIKAFVGLSRRRTRVVANYTDERQVALSTMTSFDLLGNRRRQRPNGSLEEGRLRSVGLSFAYNPTSTFVPISGNRSLYVDVEAAPGGLGDFEFASVSVRADWTSKTMGRRRLIPATLDVRVVASTFAGTLPPQRYGVLDVSDWPLSTYGTFRTAGELPIRGRQTAAVFWEHNFRTIPFELAGVRVLADRNYGLSLFGGHGLAQTGDVRLSHHEVGVSLTGILGLVRFDVAKRLDAKGYGVGFGLTRFF